ncbi:MAG: ThuA domain-containing protein [Chitinophagaceae bacterium]|nr:ThuA domain-containing protein [Chitinophagaceae bacterium]MCW5929080.1 ThuA domain-containing protein [Chitinophagaceae bacterium]
MICFLTPITKGFCATEADSLLIKKPQIVFLVSRDTHNYEADKTIPVFASKLEKQYGLVTTLLMAEGERTAAHFPRLQEVLAKADLLVIFARRLALPPEQMNIIKNWFDRGKPLVGIRTANHAFSIAKNELKQGYVDWWDFVPDILGCLNDGYGPVEPGTDVSIAKEQKNHEILKNVPEAWHSNGNLYRVSGTTLITPLLTGNAGADTQPIAWTRLAGKSRIFYTSLGHPDDFTAAPFITLLTNAVFWALELKKPNTP